LREASRGLKRSVIRTGRVFTDKRNSGEVLARRRRSLFYGWCTVLVQGNDQKGERKK